jgi:hypothetical protein
VNQIISQSLYVGNPECFFLRVGDTRVLNLSGHGVRRPVDLLQRGFYSSHVEPPNPDIESVTPKAATSRRKYKEPNRWPHTDAHPPVQLAGADLRIIASLGEVEK